MRGRRSTAACGGAADSCMYVTGGTLHPQWREGKASHALQQHLNRTDKVLREVKESSRVGNVWLSRLKKEPGAGVVALVF